MVDDVERVRHAYDDSIGHLLENEIQISPAKILSLITLSGLVCIAINIIAFGILFIVYPALIQDRSLTDEGVVATITAEMFSMATRGFDGGSLARAAWLLLAVWLIGTGHVAREQAGGFAALSVILWTRALVIFWVEPQAVRQVLVIGPRMQYTLLPIWMIWTGVLAWCQMERQTSGSSIFPLGKERVPR